MNLILCMHIYIYDYIFGKKQHLRSRYQHLSTVWTWVISHENVFAQVPVDLGLAETTQMAGDAYDTTDLRWEVIIERTTSGSRQPTWGLETAKKYMICVVLSGHRVKSSLWF